MNKLNEYIVFLNEHGIKALAYLEDVYLRDGKILDCIEVLTDHPRYLELKAKIQKEYDYEGRKEQYYHCLIPHEFVSLVVLEIKDIPVGFGQE